MNTKKVVVLILVVFGILCVSVFFVDHEQKQVVAGESMTALAEDISNGAQRRIQSGTYEDELMAKEMVDTALRKLERGLEADLAAGYIDSYNILSSTVSMEFWRMRDFLFDRVKREPPILDASQRRMRDLLSNRVKRPNVELVYEIKLGHPDGEKGRMKLQRFSGVTREADGKYVEDMESVEVHVDGFEESGRLSGLNTSIWYTDYQAQINKKDAEGKTVKEIAMYLFMDWLDSFKEWRENAFLITEYRDCEIRGIYEIEDDPYVSGIMKADVTYPDAKHNWHVRAICDYKVIGASGNGFAFGGGGAFGNDGLWIDSFIFYNSTEGFILTEWEDRYTLETVTCCKEHVKGCDITA